MKRLDKIADEETITFLGIWDEIQNRGIRRFVSRVKAGYKELFGVCSLSDDWFCTNRQALALPLLYFLGAEIMIETLFSDRINRYTTIDREKAKELRQEFDNSFVDELKSSLEIINAGEASEAGDVFSYVEVIP